MRGASDRDTARVLSDFAARLSFEGIPDQVTETVRLFIADYYGACFAGMKVNARFNQAVLDAVLGMGVKGASSVLGLEEKLPAEYAGFMNGLYAHGADLDDGTYRRPCDVSGFCPGGGAGKCGLAGCGDSTDSGI